MTEDEDTYIENMKRVSEYSDHLTLIALEKGEQWPFLVISSAGQPHCKTV